MTAILRCGDNEVVLLPGFPLEIVMEGVGCTMIGNGDLYDHCLRHADIVKHGVEITVDGQVIVRIREASK